MSAGSKAYEVIVCRKFFNFKSLKRYIVISDTMPSREMFSEKEDVVEIIELQKYEVIINVPNNQNSR